MSYYDELFKVYNEKSEVNRLENICRYVDGIDASNRIGTLQAIICEFEGQNNNASFYSVMGLVYTLIVMFFSFMVASIDLKDLGWKWYIGAIVAAVALIGLMMCHAVKEKNKTKERTFIINALRFKYEELVSSSTNPGAQRDYDKDIDAEGNCISHGITI